VKKRGIHGHSPSKQPASGGPGGDRVAGAAVAGDHRLGGDGERVEDERQEKPHLAGDLVRRHRDRPDPRRDGGGQRQGRDQREGADDELDADPEERHEVAR